MPRLYGNSFIIIIIDAIILIISPLIAMFVRFEGVVESVYYNTLILHLPLIVIIQLAIFYAFNLYWRVWKYAGTKELIAIVAGAITSAIVLFALAFLFNINEPKSIYLLNCIFTITMIGITRLTIQMTENRLEHAVGEPIKVLIVGAGRLGVAIAKEMQAHYGNNRKVVGFIDDTSSKKGQILHGIKVIGEPNDIKKIVEEKRVQQIIIAISSVNSTLARKMLTICKETPCDVKVIPSFREMMNGDVTMRQLRNINIEDLVGREPVTLDTALMNACLAKKRILVTGAGGSIGSEICRQIAKLAPSKIILLGKSENNIYDIQQELLWNYPSMDVKAIIADIGNEKRINQIFKEQHPEVVFHAAAHKHVPLMEAQPVEAVCTNIFGTKIVAEAAIAVGVERFVMISTDKAINPTSIMGTTKRVAEMIICNLNGTSTTKFAAVRFGNVLGSRGSVVPLFRKQIDKGGPVTVTHPEMVRYFMTIPEAAQLVLQAGSIAKGGEVFVLDMGNPIKILDLACALIELSGFTPYEDIKIEYSGLRPGEKLYEELLSAEEGSMATKYEKIHIAKLHSIDDKKLKEALSILKTTEEPDKIVQLLASIVPTYQSPRIKHVSDSCEDMTASALEKAIE